MGINYISPGSVSPSPTLPDTEYWDKKLPPLTSVSGYNNQTAERLGEFLPIPTTLGAIPAARKASEVIKSLRATSDVAPSLGRRQALSTIGKGAAVAGAASVAPSMVIKALREGVPLAETAAKVDAVAPVAGTAARSITRAMGLNAVNRMRSAMGLSTIEDISHLSHESRDANQALMGLTEEAGTPERLERLTQAAESTKNGYRPGRWDETFDRSAFDEWVRRQPEYNPDDIFYHGLHADKYYGGMEPFKTTGPWAKADKWLNDNATQDELKEAIMSGKIPEEWARNGVTQEHIVESLWPEGMGMGGQTPWYLQMTQRELDEVHRDIEAQREIAKVRAEAEAKAKAAEQDKK
jgi:hypothetical protein